VSGLLADLKAARERLPQPTPEMNLSRALDCAIAAIEESEAWLCVETEACHYAMLAAMERAWRGEGEK